MVKKMENSPNFSASPTPVELEFLELLLEPEDAAYPWNPADDQAQAYFDELEQNFGMQDLLDEELHARAESFYEKLDNLWSEVTHCLYYKCNTESGIFHSLCETLHNTFAAKIPTDWLNAIAQMATEVVVIEESIGEQLIQCVQAVLPDWNKDDLAVFARPYIYAMRSGEPRNLTSIMNKVENRDWLTLSEIEQAKVSVAIAYYALRQLNRLQTKA